MDTEEKSDRMPYGIVKERKNDLAVVVMERQDMCGDCHACEMMSGKKQCTLTCKDDIKSNIGDRVEITLGAQHFLKATYIMYGVPLIGFVGGLIISLVFTKLFHLKIVDLWVTLGMILGMMIGVFYIRCREKKRVYQKYLPHVIAKIKEE